MSKLKLRVQNYQSIKDVELEAEQGQFVAVVGRTDIGKSAMLRAVEGLLTNSPVKSDIRRGARFVRVKATLPSKDEIQWEKREKGQASYIVNGETYEKLAKGIPPIFESLSLTPVKTQVNDYNLVVRQQFDPLFLINDSRGMVALIEKLGDFNKYNRAHQLCKLQIRQDNQELKRVGEEIKDVEDELEKYKQVEDIEKLVEELDKQEEDLKELEKIYTLSKDWTKSSKELEILQKFLSLLEPVEKINVQELELSLLKITKLKEIKETLKDLLKGVLTLKERLSAYSKLDEINVIELEEKLKNWKQLKIISEGLNTLKVVSSIKLPELHDIEEKLLLCERAEIRLCKLQGLYETFVQKGNELIQIFKEIKQIEEEIKKIMEEMPDICPTCGNDLKD